MFKVLFMTKSDKTVSSVKDAFFRETGSSDWGYDSDEDIERGIREGFLEFKDGNMIVYGDIN